MTVDADQRLALAMTIPGAPVGRLCLDQYHRMIQTGILTDDVPVAFLEGLPVTNMPKNAPHSLATDLTRNVLAQVVPAQGYVAVQEAFTADDSEPEADVLVVRGERRQCREHHSQTQDGAPVVEVADATLQRDRTLKQRIDARERKVELASESEADDAQRHDVVEDAVIPVILDGAEVARLPVRDLLS